MKRFIPRLTKKRILLMLGVGAAVIVLGAIGVRWALPSWLSRFTESKLSLLFHEDSAQARLEMVKWNQWSVERLSGRNDQFSLDLRNMTVRVSLKELIFQRKLTASTDGGRLELELLEDGEEPSETDHRAVLESILSAARAIPQSPLNSFGMTNLTATLRLPQATRQAVLSGGCEVDSISGGFRMKALLESAGSRVQASILHDGSEVRLDGDWIFQPDWIAPFTDAFAPPEDPNSSALKTPLSGSAQFVSAANASLPLSIQMELDSISAELADGAFGFRSATVRGWIFSNEGPFESEITLEALSASEFIATSLNARIALNQSDEWSVELKPFSINNSEIPLALNGVSLSSVLGGSADSSGMTARGSVAIQSLVIQETPWINSPVSVNFEFDEAQGNRSGRLQGQFNDLKLEIPDAVKGSLDGEWRLNADAGREGPAVRAGFEWKEGRFHFDALEGVVSDLAIQFTLPNTLENAPGNAGLRDEGSDRAIPAWIEDLELFLSGRFGRFKLGDILLTNAELQMEGNNIFAKSRTIASEIKAESIALPSLPLRDFTGTLALTNGVLQARGGGLSQGQRVELIANSRMTDAYPYLSEIQITVPKLSWKDYEFALDSEASAHITGDVSMSGRLSVLNANDWTLAAKAEMELAELGIPEFDLAFQELSVSPAIVLSSQGWSLGEETASFVRFSVNQLNIEHGAVQFSAKTNAVIRAQLKEGILLGGTLATDAMKYHVESGDFSGTLIVNDLRIAQLMELFPHIKGRFQGALSGEIPIARKAGKLYIRNGRVALNPEYPAIIQTDMDGLLTKGVSPGAPRYKQLKMAEDAFQNLTVDKLIIELFQQDKPNRAATLALSGTARSEKVIVPVEFTLNINGAVMQLLHLVIGRDMEIEF